MMRWLVIILVVLVAWGAISLLLGLLEFAIGLAGLLALPAAIFLGYLLWKRGQR